MSFVRAAATLAVAAIALTGCAGSGASPTPTYTAVPIGPTAWPSGTTGQFGLKIDPSLLGKLPAHAGAAPILEDAGSEAIVLDDADAAKTIDRYVAASAGGLGDPDWLNIAVVHFKTESQNEDVYSNWVEQYAAGACSQASGVSGTDQQDIGDFRVDISTCAGGITVYTFQRGDGVVISMYELGPKHIGRALIAAIY